MVDKEKRLFIFGNIKGKEGEKALAGLTVEALDQNLLVDKRLRSTTTGQDGSFEIFFTGKKVEEIFLDQKPDIYLRIKNQMGEVIHVTENKVRYEPAGGKACQIRIPEDLLEKAAVEVERSQFKRFLSINPNYFGNVIDEKMKAIHPAIYPISKKTKYEELCCVGLYPEDNLLEAVLEVKLPFGYNGSLCTAGSKEYVSFYIDYNDGSGYTSTGAAVAVNVHNFSSVSGGHLFYAVRKPFTPKAYLKCDQPQLVKVRAILSWEKLPLGPDFIPVWGNVLDSWVQIKPKKTWPFVMPIPAYEFKPLEKMEDLQTSTNIVPEAVEAMIPYAEKLMMIGGQDEMKDLLEKSMKAEKRVKEEGKVEKERFDFKQCISKNPNYFGAISESKDKDKVMKALYDLPPKTIQDLLPKIAIDPEWLVPVKPLLVNTKYEALRCVGFHPEDDLLEAIIEIKQPYGFNGDLCTLGSKEYVVFYIDWGDGSGFQHVATATVGVHDIPAINSQHLFYAVKANITSKPKECTIENIVRVRAILSWNQDPTPFGPNYNPAWGNMLERDIQIRPKDGASVQCEIEIVNEVHADDISSFGSSKGLAVKIDSSNHAVAGTFDRPFGGIIGCWGKINVPGAHYYRFRYSDDSGLSWKNITDKRIARNPLPWISTIERYPDLEGWFSISDYQVDVANYSLSALVHWDSSGNNGDYLLRLELGDAGKNLLPGQSAEAPVRLDNKGIDLFEFGGTPTPLPAEGVVVKDSANHYRKCDTFNGDEAINIFGNFKDDYFRNFVLTVFGGNIAVSGVAFGSGRYDSGIFDKDGNPLPALSGHINDKGITFAADGGMGQEIGTLNLCTISQSPGQVKCAYGIKLTVWDRAIVGYIRGYEFDTTCHGRHAYVTFDWDPVGC